MSDLRCDICKQEKPGNPFGTLDLHCSHEPMLLRISALEKKLAVARECLEYFIGRVEAGTIRSNTTFLKFKEALEAMDKP